MKKAALGKAALGSVTAPQIPCFRASENTDTNQSNGMVARHTYYNDAIDAADAYAEILAVRRKSGKPIGPLDAMIAAITKSRGAKLATRNTKDFIHCEIGLMNPWEIRNKY